MTLHHSPHPLTPQDKQRIWAVLGAVATEDDEALLIPLQDLTRGQLVELVEALARMSCWLLEQKADSSEHLAERLRVWALRAALEGSR